MIRSIGFALAALLALCAPNARAMEGDGTGRAGHGNKAGEMGLTSEQMAKFKAISGAQKAEMKPLLDQARERMKELKALRDAKAGNDLIMAKLAEIRKLREAMHVIRQKYADQRDQVLTPTQRADKALKMEERKEGKKAEKGGKDGKCPQKNGAGPNN